MLGIRAFKAGDEPALAAICLRTAAAGGDASGLLDDDDIWANVFLLPYLVHDPELAFVVETGGGRVVGFVVAASDTDGFEKWFGRSWWPGFARRWPEPTQGVSRQDELLSYAYGRGNVLNRHVARYPAHLHINLLPEAQRQGWGRRLIEQLGQRLREAGVQGLHVTPLAENRGALAFYERLGFTVLGQEPGVVVFGLQL